MRQSVAAIALIRRKQGGRTLWLAQWNANWNAFALVGGHKWESETFRECAVREIAEELGLFEGADCLIADEPTAHLEYEAWSKAAQEETAYVMELFDIDLTGEGTRMKIDANPANRWLTEEEMQAQQTLDGKSVSQTMVRVLAQTGLLNVDESPIGDDV
jgi:isopentenyldiphosphate isomerase